VRETPIRDYAAVGDGRTVALVGRDASVDWLCLPDLDSPSALGALLDPDRGGRFALAPEVPYDATRRYLPGTNVLETTFTTGAGEVRVVDAMALPVSGLEPERAFVRRVEAGAGRVPMRWSVDPRFGYGLARTRVSRRAGVPVATSGSDALGVCAWDAGDVACDGERVHGAFAATEGAPATFALVAAHQEPLVLPRREHVERSLDSTVEWWRRWSDGLAYRGPWSDAVVRSALALQLLVHAPTGAVAAAATTSLPEELGGERNWDYRYCWVRDSAFTLDALLALDCAPEADAFFWWLMHASQVTQPRLQVLYQLDGGARARERVLPLAGYAQSTPVRVGNGAVDQLQLDVYGDLLHTAWRYAGVRGRLDGDVGRRLARIADHVCDVWRERDAGLWEVRSAPEHFTQSKMMC
jgi:GH15 family glucan-1,4-alpha-glucosidase